ncbi:MAG: hypothetical protein C4306_03935 [Thermoleophilia bacterium]
MATHLSRPAQPGSNRGGSSPETLVVSYRRLAEVFHLVLSEETLDTLLDRIADTLAELVPYDSLHIYEADLARRELVPVLARSEWEKEIMRTRPPFGHGITGWAVANSQPVLANKAHLDPRVAFVPGTPAEPEALISVPLVARGALKGALNIYRLGEAARFHEDELELAKWLADAAALAIDNAQVRARLEYQAQTDSLTGLYNHRTFHERLRAELARANRVRDSVALVMLDIDDFKRVNDICGHAVGDGILVALAETLSSLVRASDIVCRTGGEELAVIMPSCGCGDALGLARRLQEKLGASPVDGVGEITVSIGIAAGPEHATNPRELAACAEMAMMTAKARGKSQVVIFDEEAVERPQAPDPARDVRSIAHLKLLQNLVNTLSRLSSVREIAAAIVTELRGLIDYHSCRVYLVEGHELVPVAVKGDVATDEEHLASLRVEVGKGLTGYVAATGSSLLVANALECEHALQIPGTEPVDESVIAVPFRFGSRVSGVVFLSKLGVSQFDENDLRLLEVLAGYASVALENARLYEAAKREAENAKAWLEFLDAVSATSSVEETEEEIVRRIAVLARARRCSLWLEDPLQPIYRRVAQAGEAAPSGWPETVPKLVAEAMLESRPAPFFLDDETRRELYGKGEGREVVGPLPPAPGVRGWIAVGDPVDSCEACLRLLEGLAHRASTALREALLRRDQEQSLHVANALLDFARALSRAERSQVAQRIVEQAGQTLAAEVTSLWLQERSDEDLAPIAAWHRDSASRGRVLELRYPPSLAKPFARRSAPFVLRFQDCARIPGAVELAEGRDLAVCPFSFADGRTGFLVAGVTPPAGFDPLSLKMLAGLADQAKLALASAR